METVVVKVFYECEGRERPEIRRFPGPNDSAPTYAFVHDKVTQAFKQLEAGTFNMYWKDGEGDFVTCSSEQEMKEALCSVKDSVLRIYIRDVSPVLSEDDERDFDPRMQGWGRGWGWMGGMRGGGAMPMRGMHPPPPPHVHRWMKRMKRWNKKNKCHEAKAEGEVTPGEEFDINTADDDQAGKHEPHRTEGRGGGNDTEMKPDGQNGTQRCGREKGRGKHHKHDKHHVEDSQTKDDETSGSSEEDMPPPFYDHPGMLAGGPMPFWGMMGMHPDAWGGGCWNRGGGWRRGGRGGCKRSWEWSNGTGPWDMGFVGWEDGRCDPREGCRGRFRSHPRGEGHGHAHSPRRRCRRQNEADEPMEACIEEMRNVKATDDVNIMGNENEAHKM
ncbi:uncharacterized protein [Haliotis asinina]|uniref:uncharacterized protein n=1 Tax=Haliotis asinina TaxID=109174 RepID=UPI003531AEB9